MKQHRGLTEAKSRRTLLNMTTLLTRKDGSLLVPVQTPPSPCMPLGSWIHSVKDPDPPDTF